MTDLTQALVELRRVTPPSSPWEAGDFGVGSSPVDYHIATILNAVLSGDLIPVQCCMCGKTGLSIREGDGGPECQLDDGRWTCSRECWDRATGDLIPRAEAAEAELATLRAQVERLTGLIQWAHDTLWELNPGNYGHDDVCKVNDAAVEVILGLAPIIGETHGHSVEWWEARAALTEGAAP